MGSRSLRSSIRNRVYSELRSRLNSQGMNVTDKRVAAVMITLRDHYGYENVTQADITKEAGSSVRRLVT